MVSMPTITQAETFSSENISASFPVPDGFTAQDFAEEEKGVFGVQVVADDQSVLYLTGYIEDETYVGVSMESITDEQMEAIGRIFFEEEPFEFELAQEDDYSTIDFYAADGSKMVIAVVFDDGFIDFDALVSAGEELTDEQYDAFFAFLDSIVFEEE